MAENIKIAQLLDLSAKELKLSRTIIKAQQHDKKTEYVNDNHMFYLPSAGEIIREKENKKLSFDIASILCGRGKNKSKI